MTLAIVILFDLIDSLTELEAKIFLKGSDSSSGFVLLDDQMYGFFKVPLYE
jgi:hypothetical protein